MYLKGATALHMAAITGDLGVCRILVGAGADLEAHTSGEEQKTPLHFAVERLHVDIVELLLEAGADVNAEVTLIHRNFSNRQLREIVCLKYHPLHLVSLHKALFLLLYSFHPIAEIKWKNANIKDEFKGATTRINY